MTVTEQLAAFAIDFDGAAIPDAVRACARLHLLDALGCGLAAVALQLAGRVRPEPLGDGGAPSRFAGGARLVTRDGRTLDRFIDHAPGSPRNPLDEEWVLGKFRANAVLGLDPGSVEGVEAALRGLDTESPVAAATAVLRS